MIFVMTLVVFFTLVSVTGLLYMILDRIILKPKSLGDRYAKELIDQSGIGWLSTVLYASFVAFVFFILATAFSVELIYHSYTRAFFYIVVIFPFAIIAALTLYFVAKFIAIRIIR